LLYIVVFVFFYCFCLACFANYSDQRITNDVDSFMKLQSQLFTKLFSSPITIIYYTFMFRTLGWIGPVACYLYFFMGSIMNKILISPIVALWFMQEYHEGNFRFSHVTLRTNAESIAFYRGQEREQQINNQFLERVLSNRWKIVTRNMFLNRTYYY